MRDYGRIRTSFWTDEKVRALSSLAKLLAAYLLSCPHSNAIGCFRLPAGYICEDLDWDRHLVDDCLTEVCRAGFVCRDDKTGWTLLPNHFKHNTIENGNVGVACQRLVELVPKSLPFYSRLLTGLEQYANRFADGFLERMRQGMPIPEPKPEPLPEPLPIAAAEAREARAKAVAIGKHVMGILGVEEDPNWFGDGARVEAWLAQGADAEADIYPTIRRVMAKRGTKGPPRTLSYFDEAIADAIATRKKPMPEGTADDRQADQAEPGDHTRRAEAALARYRERLGEGVRELPSGDADPVLPAVSGQH